MFSQVKSLITIKEDCTFESDDVLTYFGDII